MKTLTRLCTASLMGTLLTLGHAGDTTPQAQLERWQTQSPLPADAKRGHALFFAPGRNNWACTTCHNAPPRLPGEHVTTKKHIAPLAPAHNAAAFTRTRKVDKWFRRNCNDVKGRECSAQEKADVLAYLLSVR